jgi:uncharacterized protein YjbI with pentapeptide repeats
MDGDGNKEAHDDAVGQARFEAEWVALQCDDRVFHVLRDTLLRDDTTLFHALFRPGSVSAASLRRNLAHPSRPYMMDRSPAGVAPLLQFLRTGDMCAATDGERAAARLEAQYFGVDRAVEALDEAESKRHAVAPLTRRDVERALMANATGTAVNFCGMNFAGVDLSRLSLRGADLSRANLEGADLSLADLTGATLTQVAGSGATFAGATLTNAVAKNADFRGGNFERAALQGANLSKACLSLASFVSADMERAVLDGSDMTAVLLQGTRLTGTSMRHTVLHDVRREGTSLTMGGIVSQ